MELLKQELAELLALDARTKEQKARIHEISMEIANLKKEAKEAKEVEVEEVDADA